MIGLILVTCMAMILLSLRLRDIPKGAEINNEVCS